MEKTIFNNKNLLLQYLEKLQDIKTTLNSINDLINLDSNLINKNLNNQIINLYSQNNYKTLINNLELFGKTNVKKIYDIQELKDIPVPKQVQIIEDNEIIENIEETEILEDDFIIIEEESKNFLPNTTPIITKKQSINGYLYKDTKNSNILGKVKIDKSTRLVLFDQNGNKLNIKLEPNEYNIYDYTKDEKNKIKELRITPDNIKEQQWLQL